VSTPNVPEPAEDHPFVRHPHRTLLTLSIPMVGSLVAEPLTGVVDSLLVARLGTQPLAALGVAVPLLSLVLFAFNFLSIGTQTLVAKALGAGDPEGARATGGLAVALGLSLGVGLALAGAAAAGPTVRWMGADETTFAPAVTYLHIRLLGAPAVLATMAAFGALRGVQDLQTPLWIAVATNTLNLLLDIALIFGVGPFPRLELAGAAWASCAAQWLGAGAALYGVVMRLGVTPRLDWRGARQLLVVGSDLFLRTALLLTFITLAGRAAMRLGAEAGAAHALIRSIWMLAAFFLDAFAVVAQSLVGYFVGAARIDLARRVAATCMSWSLATGVLAGALMLAGTPWLLAALPEEARPMAGAAWTVAALSQPINALSFGTDGVHWGTGDYRFLRNAMLLATAVGAAGLSLGLPVGQQPLAEVWWVTTAWVTVRAGAGLLRIWPGIGRAPLHSDSPH